MKGKKGFALLLIFLGSLIVLDIGLGLGHVMGFIIPLAMVCLGYVGIKNGSKLFGWVLFAIGLLVLVGKMSGLIWIALAVGFIVYGWSLLKRNSKAI
jgi:lia operon protein LiaI